MDSNIVGKALHDAILRSLPADLAAQLASARGGGSATREVERALMLADRATRDWAGGAVASLRNGPNQFETLERIGKPEHGNAVTAAARAEASTSTEYEAAPLNAAVLALGVALAELDDLRTPAQNRSTFREVGNAAARVLTESAEFLGTDNMVAGHHGFTVEQANRALEDLVALSGWTSQLSPP